MNTPNTLSGYLYPSLRVNRCPRFHACLASKKCQNYDQHNLECQVCETRTSDKENIGGYVAEGTYMPDVQDDVRTMEKMKHQLMADPDRETQTINGHRITQEHNEYRRASERLGAFAKYSRMTMEEEYSETVYLNKDLLDNK